MLALKAFLWLLALWQQYLAKVLCKARDLLIDISNPSIQWFPNHIFCKGSKASSAYYCANLAYTSINWQFGDAFSPRLIWRKQLKCHLCVPACLWRFSVVFKVVLNRRDFKMSLSLVFLWFWFWIWHCRTDSSWNVVGRDYFLSITLLNKNLINWF